jgi:hypothetical protein
MIVGLGDGISIVNASTASTTNTAAKRAPPPIPDHLLLRVHRPIRIAHR